jgi:hypothetical protein
LVEWKNRLTDTMATASHSRAPSPHEVAGINRTIRAARTMPVPTRMERRENRSMNGPVSGPTREKGI